RQYALSYALHPFFTFSQISIFREMQKKLDIVISGSVAIQFFEAVRYDDCDLDLYVHVGNATRLKSWLKSIHYTECEPLRRRRGGPPFYPCYIDEAIIIVDTFTKDGKSIQVISTRNTVIEAILDFSLTCAMNIITHDEAISFYPYATFEQRECLLLDNRFLSTRNAVVEKYRRRGWTVIETLDPSVSSNPRSDFYCPSTNARTRFVGDKWCWRIALD
ncbi:hypothetical protein BDN72DRAFT_721394, partial [Pluteus cervinus]